MAVFTSFAEVIEARGNKMTVRSRNTSILGLVRAGVIAAGAGRTRLLGRAELDADWVPGADRHPTVWKTTQHLLRALENGGDSAAAALMAEVGGGRAEQSRELAYRLHKVCQAKGWAQEAASLNGLVADWPDLATLARWRQAAGGGASQLIATSQLIEE